MKHKKLTKIKKEQKQPNDWFDDSETLQTNWLKSLNILFSDEKVYPQCPGLNQKDSLHQKTRAIQFEKVCLPYLQNQTMLKELIMAASDAISQNSLKPLMTWFQSHKSAVHSKSLKAFADDYKEEK